MSSRAPRGACELKLQAGRPLIPRSCRAPRGARELKRVKRSSFLLKNPRRAPRGARELKRY